MSNLTTVMSDTVENKKEIVTEVQAPKLRTPFPPNQGWEKGAFWCSGSFMLDLVGGEFCCMCFFVRLQHISKGNGTLNISSGFEQLLKFNNTYVRCLQNKRKIKMGIRNSTTVIQLLTVAKI